MLPLCLVKIFKNVANTCANKDKINPFPVSRFPFPVSRFPFPVSRFPFPVTPQTAQETQPNAGSQRWLQ